MIGGQYLDVTDGTGELARLHALKTGRLFAASVASALWIAEVPREEQRTWREFADEFGLLYQIVDDILDHDGFVLERGAAGARALAEETEGRARARLGEIPADTSRLDELVSGLIARANAS
jgi:farnesyl diphosphate synthase